MINSARPDLSEINEMFGERKRILFNQQKRGKMSTE